MDNFIKYYKENNSEVIWKIADIIKLRDTLKLRGHKISEVRHNLEDNTVDIIIEYFSHVFSSNNINNLLRINYIFNKKLIGIFFNFYVFDKLDNIQYMDIHRNIRSESIEDQINEIVEKFDDIIGNLEKITIEKFPEKIKAIENPSKWAQEFVIQNKGPFAYLWINNPDSELKKKYGHLKDLAKAGIFESAKNISRRFDTDKNLAEQYNQIFVIDAIRSMGLTITYSSRRWPAEGPILIFELAAKNPILNGKVNFSIEIKNDEFLIKFSYMDDGGLKTIYLQYKFKKEENEFNQRIEKIESTIKYLESNAEEHLMKEDPSNIVYITNPSRWAQDLAIEKLGINITTKIKNLDPELEIKYGHLKDLVKAGIMEYYFDIV